MTDLAQKVKDQLRGGEIGFNIGEWVSNEEDRIFDPNMDHGLDKGGAACGTVACIAGHIVLAAGFDLEEDSECSVQCGTWFRHPGEDSPVHCTPSLAISCWSEAYPHATPEQLACLRTHFLPEAWADTPINYANICDLLDRCSVKKVEKNEQETESE